MSDTCHLDGQTDISLMSECPTQSLDISEKGSAFTNNSSLIKILPAIRLVSRVSVSHFTAAQSSVWEHCMCATHVICKDRH